MEESIERGDVITDLNGETWLVWRAHPEGVEGIDLRHVEGSQGLRDVEVDDSGEPVAGMEFIPFDEVAEVTRGEDL